MFNFDGLLSSVKLLAVASRNQPPSFLRLSAKSKFQHMRQCYNLPINPSAIWKAIYQSARLIAHDFIWPVGEEDGHKLT